MVTIQRVGGLKIQIYADDHHPPHFHIVGPDFEVLVRVADFAILRGGRRQREIEPALNWAREHRTRLESEWMRLNEA